MLEKVFVGVIFNHEVMGIKPTINVRYLRIVFYGYNLDAIP
jgi:hypothetical protein